MTIDNNYTKKSRSGAICRAKIGSHAQIMYLAQLASVICDENSMLSSRLSALSGEDKQRKDVAN